MSRRALRLLPRALEGARLQGGVLAERSLHAAGAAHWRSLARWVAARDSQLHTLSGCR